MGFLPIPRPASLVGLVALLGACSAPVATPVQLSEPPASALETPASDGDCTLIAYPATVEAGDQSIFIGEGFRFGAEITLTLHDPGDGDAIFTSADTPSLKVTDGTGFAVQAVSEAADSGETIDLEATDGSCVARTPWAIAAPGSQPSTPTPDPTPCDRERSLADRADEASGFQVHLLYALAADSEDAAPDGNGELARGAGYANDWLAAQTRGSRFRFDTCEGLVDVSFARLPGTEATYVGARDWRLPVMESELRASGFDDPAKIYAVWWGGLGPHCGGEAPSPSEPGAFVWLYARDLDGSGCNRLGASPRSSANLDLLHEVIHALGMVAPCAPNTSAEDPTHVTDRTDLLNNQSATWDEIVLDLHHDDYYDHDIAGCPDLADSVFIDPLPLSPAPPPGW